MDLRLAGYGAAVLLAAYALTRWFLPRIVSGNLTQGHVDAPGERKPQESAVPYGGGQAILVTIVLLVASGVLAVLLARGLGVSAGGVLRIHGDGLLERSSTAAVWLFCALWMAHLGRRDDRGGLSIRRRLVEEVLAATVTAAMGLRLSVFLPSPSLQILLTVIWFVAMTNAFNFIDNMDALLPGVATSIALSLAIVAGGDGQWFAAAMALAILGSTAAVLGWNRPPARVYMGDEGSLGVGFLLAGLGVAVTYGGEFGAPTPAWAPLIVPLGIFALPLADMGFVIVRRLRERRPPWQAGRDHLSHVLTAKLGSESAVHLLVGLSYLGGASVLAVYGWDSARGKMAIAPLVLGLEQLRRAMVRWRSP
ncbi:MAG TPA: undecaprenyl/decaprenyl-phosphate alpha-N-acetylglucosaminyl 1-phosphate transferase [Planctomycetes bacterium]|nr:undecaprenyl/decaprenyl-phosphate alpha-N-acetylglucosaminyl 1-phosphate transferase [Planctomycetota bacterium]